MAQIIICAGISFTSPMRPVGAFQIASVLRRQGYTVQVIDSWPYIASMGPETVKQILGHFTTKDTLWIGFSSTWFRNMNEIKRVDNIKEQASSVYSNQKDLIDNTYLFDDDELADIKKFILDKSPNCKFVMGGGRAPLGRLKSRRGNFIDCWVEGYADSTVVELSKYLEGKNPSLPYVKNFDDSISITHDHKASNFDYNNDRFSWHESDLVRPGEALPMEIARGCIFTCSFCSYPLNGRKKLDYLKDPSILLEQFEENYSRFGTTHYWLLDDTFNDSPEKLQILYDRVFSKLSFKINFNAFMRLDLMAAHPHTIDLIAASGAGGLSFGIESLNYEALKSIGKGIRKEKIISTLHSINEKMPKGTYVDSQFIIGLPFETKDTAREWITEVTEKDFPLDNAKIHVLTMNPFRGLNNIWTSNFEQQPEKYGYIIDPLFPWAWKNNMGFNLRQAFQLHTEMYPRLMAKEMDGWLTYAGFMNMGLTEDQARELTRTTNKRDRRDFESGLRKTFVKNYIQQLLQLDPQ